MARDKKLPQPRSSTSNTDTFRWRFVGKLALGEKTVVVAGALLELDNDGFVVSAIANEKVESKLKASPLFDLVAMNNDAIWTRRLAESQARVDRAEQDRIKSEQDAIRAADLVRLTKEQHQSLLDEKARLDAAIGSVAGAQGDED